MYFGSNSSNARRVFFSQIFGYRSFTAVFADKGNTHVFLQFHAVALLLVDHRVIIPILSDDEAEALLCIEVLSLALLE